MGPMASSRRVLVTGASGFVGRPTVASLRARGAQVHEGPRRDLLDPAGRAAIVAEANAEILIHLAWVTEHGMFWSSPSNADWEQASVDLFHRFYASGGQRIVGIGSCAEYDWTTGAESFAENARIAPHTDYGEAKGRTSEALAKLAEQHGASQAWGRLFFSFGPNEPTTRLIPALISSVVADREIACGPSETVRDFWHVHRLGEALAAIALSEVEGPVNVASGVATSFGQVASIIESALGKGGLIRTGGRPLNPGEPTRILALTKKLEQLGISNAAPDTDLIDYCKQIEAASRSC